MDKFERVTFDVFSTEFSQTMTYSFSSYLKGLETCTTPEEMMALHEEFVLFNSKVYAQLTEVVDSAEHTDYH